MLWNGQQYEHVSKEQTERLRSLRYGLEHQHLYLNAADLVPKPFDSSLYGTALLGAPTRR